jgi:predicted house-cleaning noncanonical NTP pyrophosphatase (MazG superfamily)
VGKLVRDRIPEIMCREGKTPQVEEIEGDRLKTALKDKLVEEATELRDAVDIREELADVMEVAEALIDAYGIDEVELLAMRWKKREERGGFDKGYFLK